MQNSIFAIRNAILEWKTFEYWAFGHLFHNHSLKLVVQLTLEQREGWGVDPLCSQKSAYDFRLSQNLTTNSLLLTIEALLII